MAKLKGTKKKDVLKGKATADLLLGLWRKRQAHRGGGDDILDGGVGNDKLNGGAGNDTYVLGDGRSRCRHSPASSATRSRTSSAASSTWCSVKAAVMEDHEAFALDGLTHYGLLDESLDALDDAVGARCRGAARQPHRGLSSRASAAAAGCPWRNFLRAERELASALRPMLARWRALHGDYPVAGVEGAAALRARRAWCSTTGSTACGGRRWNRRAGVAVAAGQPRWPPTRARRGSTS